MRRLLLPSLLAALTLLVVLVEPAFGQTPPPPPGPPGGVPPSSAPTPTPVPSAGALGMLQTMQGAMIAAGSLHYTLKSTTVAPGTRQVAMTTAGAVSFGNNAVHYASTIVRTRLNRQPHTSTTVSNELEAIGSHAAWRVPSVSWQCESLLHTAATAQLLAFQAQTKSAEVVGTRTVAGIVVTHIRAKAAIYPWTGNQIDTVDYDISQQTGTAVRITSSFTTSLNGARAKQTLTERYSAYGTPVSVTLPKKCRGS